jgi:hypothetical protein
MNLPIGDQSGMPRQDGRGARGWVWVLVAVFSCCGLLCAAAVGFVWYFGRNPANFTAEYSIPSIVNRGDEFELVIRMTNTGTEPVTVNDIDLDQAFGGSILDGALVLSTEPEMERDYSLSGIKTFRYNRPIPPGETHTVVFHLQASAAGEFGGSIGIYVGDLSYQFDYVALIVQEP